MHWKTMIRTSKIHPLPRPVALLDLVRIFDKVTTARLVLRRVQVIDGPAIFRVHGATNLYNPYGPHADLATIYVMPSASNISPDPSFKREISPWKSTRRTTPSRAQVSSRTNCTRSPSLYSGTGSNRGLKSGGQFISLCPFRKSIRSHALLALFHTGTGAYLYLSAILTRTLSHRQKETFLNAPELRSALPLHA